MLLVSSFRPSGGLHCLVSSPLHFNKELPNWLLHLSPPVKFVGQNRTSFAWLNLPRWC